MSSYSNLHTGHFYWGTLYIFIRYSIYKTINFWISLSQRCHGGTICEDVICRAKENCTSQCVTGASCNTMTCDSKYCKLTCLEASNCGSMICSRAQCDMECDKSARCGSMICKKGVEQCNMLVRERSNSPVKMECSSDRCNMTCDRHSVCEHMECLPGVKECNMFVRNSNKVKAKSPGDRVRMICHSGNCTLRCETGSFCEWMECKRGVERCNMTCDDQTECYMRCGAKNCGFNCGPQSTCKVKKVLNDENDGKSLHEHMLFLLITFVFLSMMIAHR